METTETLLAYRVDHDSGSVWQFSNLEVTKLWDRHTRPLETTGQLMPGMTPIRSELMQRDIRKALITLVINWDDYAVDTWDILDDPKAISKSLQMFA